MGSAQGILVLKGALGQEWLREAGQGKTGCCYPSPILRRAQCHAAMLSS